MGPFGVYPARSTRKYSSRNDRTRDRACFVKGRSLWNDGKAPPATPAGQKRSVLTREQDGVVREVERNAVQRKVRVLELLGVDNIVVAILAGQHASMIGAYRELPDLELLSFEARVVRLNDRDLVEEPVGPSLIGDEFGAVGEEHRAGDAVAMPALAPGELRQF